MVQSNLPIYDNELDPELMKKQDYIFFLKFNLYMTLKSMPKNWFNTHPEDLFFFEVLGKNDQNKNIEELVLKLTNPKKPKKKKKNED